MVKQGLATNLGSYVKGKSYQISFSDLQGTSGSGAKSFTLDTLGQGSLVLYVRVKHLTSFAGGNLTAMKVRVGKSGGTTNFFTNDFDVFQAPADGTLLEVSDPPAGQLSAMTLTATFTPTGDNCSAATAGLVAIDIFSLNITTPTAVSLYGSTQVL